jgi:hypothetical protein
VVQGEPGGASVGGVEDGAVGAAGPGYFAADCVDAAEAGGGVGVLDLELGVGGDGEEKDERGAAHVLWGRISESGSCLRHSHHWRCGPGNIVKLTLVKHSLQNPATYSL